MATDKPFYYELKIDESYNVSPFNITNADGKIVIAKPTRELIYDKFGSANRSNTLSEQIVHTIHSLHPTRVHYIFNKVLNGFGFINGENTLYIYVNGHIHVQPNVSITSDGKIMKDGTQFRFDRKWWKDDGRGNAKLISNMDCNILNLYPNKENPIFIEDYIHADIRGDATSVSYLGKLLARFAVIGTVNPVASLFPHEGGQAFFDAFDNWLSATYKSKLSSKEFIQSNIMFPNLFTDVNGIVLDTIGDGNCFLHAVMQAKSSVYRKLQNREDKNAIINKLRKHILPSFIAPVSADFLEYTDEYITDNEIPHIASFLKLNIGVITYSGPFLYYVGSVPDNTNFNEWIFMVNKSQSTITPYKISQIINNKDGYAFSDAQLNTYIDALIQEFREKHADVANTINRDRSNRVALGTYIDRSSNSAVREILVSTFKTTFPEIDAQSAVEGGSNHYETVVLQFKDRIRYSIMESEGLLSRGKLEPEGNVVTLEKPMKAPVITADRMTATAPAVTVHIPTNISSMSLLYKFILYSALDSWVDYKLGFDKIFTSPHTADKKVFDKMIWSYDPKPTWNFLVTEARRSPDIKEVKDDKIVAKNTIPEIISKAILNVDTLTSPLELYRASAKTTREGSSYVTEHPIPKGKTNLWINTTSNIALAQRDTENTGILFTFHVKPGVRILDLVETMRALGTPKDLKENEFFIDMTQAKDTGFRKVSDSPYKRVETDIVPNLAPYFYHVPAPTAAVPAPTAAVPAPAPAASSRYGLPDLPAVPAHPIQIHVKPKSSTPYNSTYGPPPPTEPITGEGGLQKWASNKKISPEAPIKSMIPRMSPELTKAFMNEIWAKSMSDKTPSVAKDYALNNLKTMMSSARIRSERLGTFLVDDFGTLFPSQKGKSDPDAFYRNILGDILTNPVGKLRYLGGKRTTRKFSRRHRRR